jgi:NADH-quinone oxidoreductase subunit H
MYGLVQLGSYLKLYAFAGLFVVLFLGGWTGPLLIPSTPPEILSGIEVGPIAVELPGSERFVERTLNAELINGVIWFVLKTVGVIFFILMPRGVFPRVRIDLLLQIGWYKLIGLAFVNIFIALGVLYSGILEPGVIF